VGGWVICVDALRMVAVCELVVRIKGIFSFFCVYGRYKDFDE